MSCKSNALTTKLPSNGAYLGSVQKGLRHFHTALYFTTLIIRHSSPFNSRPKTHCFTNPSRHRLFLSQDCLQRLGLRPDPLCKPAFVFSSSSSFLALCGKLATVMESRNFFPRQRHSTRHRCQDKRQAKTLDRDKTVTLLKCLRLRRCQGRVINTHYSHKTTTTRTIVLQ